MNASVIPIGGDNVFLACLEKVDRVTVFSDALDFFNLFFCEIRMLKQSKNIEYVIGAWLRLFGIPYHAWNMNYINIILSPFGRLLKLDHCTSKIARLGFARILIYMKHL